MWFLSCRHGVNKDLGPVTFTEEERDPGLLWDPRASVAATAGPVKMEPRSGTRLGPCGPESPTRSVCTPITSPRSSEPTAQSFSSPGQGKPHLAVPRCRGQLSTSPFVFRSSATRENRERRPEHARALLTK